jgi:GxxExxY protein
MDLLNEGLIYKNESFEIIGACMEVHRELGCGFLEAVYQEALALEFTLRKIPFEQEKLLRINYKGQTLQKEYKADFICFENIIVEVKALNKLAPEHLAQTLNYLKITEYNLGLLVNFGTTSLQYKRVVL